MNMADVSRSGEPAGMTLFCHSGPLLGMRLEVSGQPIVVGQDLAAREAWPSLPGLAERHLEIWIAGDGLEFRTHDGDPPEIDGRPLSAGRLEQGQVLKFLGCSWVLLPPPVGASTPPPLPVAMRRAVEGRPIDDDDDSDYLPNEGSVADIAHGLGKHITDAMDLERIHGFSPEEMFSERSCSR
jgi:hypothetical protein